MHTKSFDWKYIQAKNGEEREYFPRYVILSLKNLLESLLFSTLNIIILFCDQKNFRKKIFF